MRLYWMMNSFCCDVALARPRRVSFKFSSLKMGLLLLLFMGIHLSAAYVSHNKHFRPSFTRRDASTFAETTSFEATTSEDELDDSQITTTRKRTLYNVLGGKPTETRAELKRRYVALAKICHPDARRHAEAVVETDLPDFTEIAAAWRILGDEKQRKRYDRSLQAEEFSDNVLNWMGEVAKEASPVVEKFGMVMNSFLRRTTATTLAGVQAAASQVAKQSSQIDLAENNVLETTTTTTEKVGKLPADAALAGTDKTKNAIREALKSAVDAARIAGRKMDSVELLEKSEEIEAQARKESALAAKTKQELQDIVERRLSMALHTPGSGLTAAEALIILEDFNSTIADDLSAWDRAMLRHTVDYEIHDLQKVEASFVQAQKADTEAQLSYQNCLQVNFQANKNLVMAEKDEVRARTIWEVARDRLLEAKKNVTISLRELAQAEAQARKSDWEIEVRSLALEKQAEKVRIALRQKEKLVFKQRGLDPPESDAQDNEERLKELNKLRKREQMMAQTSKRLELIASKLFERAQALRERAQELE